MELANSEWFKLSKSIVLSILNNVEHRVHVCLSLCSGWRLLDLSLECAALSSRVVLRFRRRRLEAESLSRSEERGTKLPELLADKLRLVELSSPS